jgi:hypothetical protein
MRLSPVVKPFVYPLMIDLSRKPTQEAAVALSIHVLNRGLAVNEQRFGGDFKETASQSIYILSRLQIGND